MKIPRRFGSRYYTGLAPAEMERLLERVTTHANGFDARYGTEIEAALRRGIEEARLQ